MINLKLGDVKEFLPKRILNKFCSKVFKDVNLYPQNYDLLVSKLAKKHGIKPENILLINGVDEGIDVLARVFGKKTLFFSPSYFEFAEASKRNNQNFVAINSFMDNKFKIITDDKSKLKDSTLIFLCNPNNPFGLLSKTEILEIAGNTHGIVAVDETYIDFFGESVIEEFKSTPNIIVLRSFSKGYTLAGLRIGYIVGEKSLIGKIKERKIFFSVTSVSVNAAIICLEEEKYFKDLIKTIIKRKNDFEEYLSNKKFNVIKTNTNNIVIKFQNQKKANHFFNFLKDNKVVVNQGDGISTYGLNNTFIRFNCGRKEQMTELQKIIDEYR